MAVEPAPARRSITTGRGEARVACYAVASADQVATLVLTHGAGGGIDSADLLVLAETLPASGISVILVEMPWRVQGRPLAPRPPLIDETYRDVLATLRPGQPFLVGGRSAGARSACRIAAEVGAMGVVALAFPLRPPRQPHRSRLDELRQVDRPVLVLQGDRDPFGAAADFDLPDGPVRIVPVPYADHALRLPARAPIDTATALAAMAATVAEWTLRLTAGNP